jgi:cytochrome c peroxidase
VELVVSEKPTIYRHGVGCACGMGIYLPRVIRRFALPCEGPRGVALSPDGATAAVAGYFSGTVIIFDARTGREQQNDLVQREIALGPQPPTNAIRRGESAFHDARLCYQQWLACATCHPEGRTDGLNWDLMNDGVNNPKNTRSLVLAHLAGPMMARGVRGGFAEAVAAGFEHVLFRPAPEAVRRDVEAYLCSLRPHPSPALVEGNLSAAARMGKGLFESAEVGCAECHCGPLLTDAKMHDVGTQTESDWEEENAFLTPKLVESWRTAPYLHHGKAGTLREVLTKYNRADRHGRTSHLKDVEIDALVEYLRSL